MKTSSNPYMLFHTIYLDDVEKAAKRQQLRPYGEPRRSGSGGWALNLAVVVVAFGLVAITVPWMV